MRKVSFTVLLLMVFFCSSCSKNDDSIPPSERSTAILGQWEFEAIMTDRAVDLNNDNTSNIDLFNTQELPQCLKDNVTTFTANGPSGKPEYNVTENNLTCDDNTPFSIVEEDFWSLTNNNTITFENRAPFRIAEFTNNRLVLESDNIFDGQEYILTTTYRRK